MRILQEVINIKYIFYKKNENLKNKETQRKYEQIQKINEERKSILDGIKCLYEYRVSQYNY